MCFGCETVEVSATTTTFYNKCSHPVWPGIQPSAGKPILARGGFKLPPNKSYSLSLPAGWSGRFWGRHGCSFDASGRGRCATGDCGGNLFCNGLGGTPPATLAEITLGNDQDFYDVSLVDGYNLAISITPFRGSGKMASSLPTLVSSYFLSFQEFVFQDLLVVCCSHLLFYSFGI